MKGLSGAVTALILVIASVIIALIVVGFAFNLFGTYSSQGAITTSGPAYITYSNGQVIITLGVKNTGGANVTITSITINNNPVTPSEEEIISGTETGTLTTNYVIPVGQATLSITGSVSSTSPIVTELEQPGTTVSVQIYLANGQTVVVNAVVQ